MNRPSRPVSANAPGLIACAMLLSTALPALRAADINKIHGNAVLSNTAVWTGNTGPGPTDIAVWNNLTTQTNAIGGDLDFAGIKVVAGSGTHTINATTGFSLSLGSGGIDMSAATANLTIGAILNLNASQTWNVATGQTLTINGTNTGSGTITLAGTGTFITGNNAFGSGILNLENGITLGLANNQRTISNVVKLNGNITTTATGTSGSVNFAGGLDVGAGTRTITMNSASAGGYAVAFNSAITGSGQLVFENGDQTASPTLIVRFGGLFSANPAATVNSDLTIGAGVIASFLGANTLTRDSDLVVNTGGRIHLDAKAQTVGSLSGSGTVTNSNTANNSAMLTIDGGTSTQSTTFSGVILNRLSGESSTGRTGILKTGSSTQIFTGNNTHTGRTRVNGGKLFINGLHREESADSSFGYYANATDGNIGGGATDGRYHVASGGTLGGTGRINMLLANNTTANNVIYVASGGILAPGGDGELGTFTLDAAGFTRTDNNDKILNMAAGAVFDFTLAADGSGSDTLAFWNYLVGDLVLNNNVVNVSLLGVPAANGTYTVDLFRFYSDSGSTLTTGITSGLILGSLVGTGIESAQIDYNAPAGVVQLHYTVASAIPEPASWVALASGAILAVSIIGRRRRR